MAGAMSVLGLGSNSGLTGETIDKLKKVDNDSTVKPIEQKIKNNETRQSDLNTLKTIASSLKSITGSLSGEVNYLERDVKTTGNSATVTAESGTKVQTLDLDVKKLAQRDIYQSKNFQATSTPLSAGTLNIDIAGKSYSIDVSANTSLQDLKDKIYDATEGKVTASLLNVGGNDPYKFILKSTDTGLANKMTISGSTATELGFGAAIQNAQDSEVVYNGVTINRANNSIDDLIPGVKIKLNEVGKTTSDIAQKTANIGEKVEKFVEKYNELIANLQTVTKYDSKSKKSGTFQGNSDMNSVIRTLGNAITHNTHGSLESYGITMQRNGELKFDKSKLDTMLKNDFEKTKEFFSGTEKTNGLFKDVDQALDKITTSKNGIFKGIETELKNKEKSLAKGLESAKERLDSKYDVMQKQFAAYDALIAKMNANFSALKSMIDAQSSSK